MTYLEVIELLKKLHEESQNREEHSAAVADAVLEIGALASTVEEQATVLNENWEKIQELQKFNMELFKRVSDGDKPPKPQVNEEPEKQEIEIVSFDELFTSESED